MTDKGGGGGRCSYGRSEFLEFVFYVKTGTLRGKN
jgi:hypothetical protein